MARAVTFNGAQGLLNMQLGNLPDLNRGPLSCGIFSYWYKSRIPTLSAITTVSVQNTGHCFRCYHQPTGGRAVVVLQVQQARGMSTQGVSFQTLTELPFDDKWHHVMMNWSVDWGQQFQGSMNPMNSQNRAQMVLDGGSMRAGILPTGGVPPFTVDYSIADQWTVAAERGYDNYIGDLAEVYLQLMGFYVEFGSGVNFIGYFAGAQQAFQIGGKGFINMGTIRQQMAGQPPTAVEIGFDGSGALGLTGLKPQVYCAESDLAHFPDNVTGLRPRVFDTVGGSPAIATTDPFPVP